MKKEDAIKAAEKLLLNIYTDEASWDMQAVATIEVAVAEKDTETLSNALGAVKEFCSDLINDMKEVKQ